MNDLTQIANSIVETQVSLITEVRMLEVTNEQTMLQAQMLLKTVKDLRTSIEEFCEENVTAANAAHKAAVAQRKALLEPTAAAEAVLRGKLKKFADEEERKRREKEAQIRKEQAEAVIREGNDPNKLSELIPTIKVESVLDKGKFREQWLFEITDPELIPKNYLIVDMQAIGAIVRAQKDRANIPGVRVYMQKIPVA